jgi:hypothetical protein
MNDECHLAAVIGPNAVVIEWMSAKTCLPMRDVQMPCLSACRFVAVADCLSVNVCLLDLDVVVWLELDVGGTLACKILLSCVSSVSPFENIKACLFSRFAVSCHMFYISSASLSCLGSLVRACACCSFS